MRPHEDLLISSHTFSITIIVFAIFMRLAFARETCLFGTLNTGLSARREDS
jgi:hypothetical protein